MYTDNQINIIINTIKKGQGEKDAKNALKDLKSGVSALTGVNLSYIGAITTSVAVGKKLIDVGKDSIEQTISYTTRVEDLSRAIGSNAEQSSLLLQTADDLFVSDESLLQGMKNAITKGYSPTIEGLKEMRAEYAAILDPVDKTKYAIEKFGKAGLEMQKILEATPEQFAAATASATMLGTVMGQDDVEASKKYKQSLDELNDIITGLKYTLGTELIPFFTDVANGLTYLINYNKLYDRAVEDSIEVNAKAGTSYEDYAKKVIAAAVTAGKISKSQGEFFSGLTDQVDEVGDAADLARIELEQIQGKIGLITEEEYKGVAATAAWWEEWRKAHPVVTAVNSALMEEEDALAAIKAGLSGTLLKAEQAYLQTTSDLIQEQDKLTTSLKWVEQQYASAPSKIDALTLALKENEAAQAESGHTSGELVTKHQELTAELTKWEDVLEAGPGAVAGLNNSLDENTTKQKEAEEQLRKTTAQMILQNIAASLSNEAYLELARHMGLMSEADYLVAKDLLVLKEAYAAGTITQEEFTASVTKYSDTVIAASGNTADLISQLNGLPSQKTIDLYVNFHTADLASAGGGGSGAGSTPDPNTGHEGEAHNNGVNGYYDNAGAWHWWAGGGQVYAGQSGIVGEKGPEYFHAYTDGYIIPHSDLVTMQDVQNISNGGGNVSIGAISIQVSGAGDADAVADKIMRKIKMQLGGRL